MSSLLGLSHSTQIETCKGSLVAVECAIPISYLHVPQVLIIHKSEEDEFLGTWQSKVFPLMPDHQIKPNQTVNYQHSTDLLSFMSYLHHQQHFPLIRQHQSHPLSFHLSLFSFLFLLFDVVVERSWP